MDREVRMELIKRDLEELLSYRCSDEIEGFTRDIYFLMSHWPVPKPERPEFVDECRERLRALHEELYGSKQDKKVSKQ